MKMAPTWLLLLSSMHVSHEDTVLVTQAFGTNEMHRGPWKMKLPGFCHKAKVKIMSAKERIEHVKQREKQHVSQEEQRVKQFATILRETSSSSGRLSHLFRAFAGWPDQHRLHLSLLWC